MLWWGKWTAHKILEFHVFVFFVFESGFHYVIQATFELKILLSQLPIAKIMATALC
jgi:hypothetical protein